MCCTDYTVPLPARGSLLSTTRCKLRDGAIAWQSCAVRITQSPCRLGARWYYSLQVLYVMAPGRRVWMGVHKLAPCARRHGYSLARAATVYILGIAWQSCAVRITQSPCPRGCAHRARGLYNPYSTDCHAIPITYMYMYAHVQTVRECNN